MRMRFSPGKRERKIFMGTMLPEEKKVRDLLDDAGNYEEPYGEVQDENNLKKTLRKNESGL
ncbi:MAG TPA: hypothetical protein VN462_04695 [Negativicutes bacterium]|nr:hypothetical protein [Negativicutes bacterium]